MEQYFEVSGQFLKLERTSKSENWKNQEKTLKKKIERKEKIEPKPSGMFPKSKPLRTRISCMYPIYWAGPSGCRSLILVYEAATFHRREW